MIKINKKIRGFFILFLVIITGIFTLLSLTSFSNEGNEPIWSQYYLEWANSYGYIKGLPDNSFGANKKISKAEFYTIINRMFEYKDESGPEIDSLDPNLWYYNEIKKGLKAGYITDPTEDFKKLITREEASKIIARCYGLEGDESSVLKFKDSNEIEDKASVGALVSHGIISGTPEGNFLPKSYLTRGETAKILNSSHRVFINNKKPQTIMEPIHFGDDLDLEKMHEITDYLFEVYISNREEVNIKDSDGFKYIVISEDSRDYFNNIFNNQDAFSEFLIKSSKGTYYEAINFPYNIAYKDGKLYFKANFVTPNEQRILNEHIKNDINSLYMSGKIKDDMSDAERLKVLFEFLIDKASYVDLDSLDGVNNKNSKGVVFHSPYAIIEGSDAVCQAYAGYYMLLANELGINLEYVSGNIKGKDGSLQSHAWVSYKDDDGVHYIDPTNGDQPRGIDYRFFYITYEFMKLQGYEIID